ncbi:hypothetical protein SAJA_14040 [Salinisphaera japonica YTM-1]|uniref:Uncharacterized protein n=1 Tax=Salinisphaera japonica YTM-1 TaxID=1209778 RepID=A0A423PFJ2_9GAMM|nr:hypothetical protein SAJA_14040 [Salinisphaera japonica YTM-1]
MFWAFEILDGSSSTRVGCINTSQNKVAELLSSTVECSDMPSKAVESQSERHDLTLYAAAAKRVVLDTQRISSKYAT